jgi:hypothetical protein
MVVFYDQDLELAGVSGSRTYSLKFTASLLGASSEATVFITIKNPCLDRSRVYLEPAQMPVFTYTLFDSFYNAFSVPEATIQTVSGTGHLCKPVIYTLESAELTELAHNEATGMLSIYSEDMATVSHISHRYTIAAQFINYPDSKVTSEGEIFVEDPCKTMVEIYTTVATNADTDYVTPATFNFPTTVVIPSVCAELATFSCSYTMGPLDPSSVDLCSMQEGLTNV